MRARLSVAGLVLVPALLAHASDAVRATAVAAIYPTADRVPANLLKLYIEFSSPMREGEAEQRIHLLDAHGHEVPRAFLLVDEELWDASRTRLTVLFDPGRIKRGLRSNLEDGAPLVDGRRFRVVIDGTWRDARGVPLASSFEKTLIVDAADRTSPDPRRWPITAPASGTRDALIVRFDEPLDRALLDRWIVVMDDKGHRVPGRATIGDHESSWSFVPDREWRAERYQILVNPQIEDLAGNSPARPFDLDVSSKETDATHADTPFVLPFTVALEDSDATR
jgi:hypothetical protein